MGLRIVEVDPGERPRLRISLCMIMRDEEEHLERCLQSVEGVVDEIVIVDTGSVDRSIEIATAHGARIIHEEWRSDFAAPRNTGIDAATGDWILVLDADVGLPSRFLDTLLAAAAAGELRLVQPAHRRHSHAAWSVTLRRPGGDWRETNFVEIGPVTAFSREAAAELLPFPADAGMGWGLDTHWSAVAAERGWPIGVVDAAPIAHTMRPVATGYRQQEAIDEARRFLAERPYTPRGDVRTLASHRFGG